jgi:hypothetical protein
MRTGMTPVLYRCPTTGLTIDEWVADVLPEDKGVAFYEAITCRACNHIHLVNLSTGKVLLPARKRLHDDDDSDATAKIYLLDHAVGMAWPSGHWLRRVLPLALRDVGILTMLWRSLLSAHRAAGRGNFTCPHCGAEYHVTYTRLLAMDHNQAICTRCRHVMKKWNDAFSRAFELMHV